MARSNIPMVINLRQNKNDDSTAYGKYFAEVDSKEPLKRHQDQLHAGEHQGREAHQQGFQGAVRVRVRIPRGE